MRCSACHCLVRPGRPTDACGWPCSPLGFFDLLGKRHVQARRRYLARRVPRVVGRHL